MRPVASRSRRALLAGAILAIDAVLAFVLALAVLAMAVLFPPVAAIEGRPPPDNSGLLLAGLGLLVFAVAAAWAGRRAIGGRRSGRVVGILLGAAVPAFLASVAFTAPSLDAVELALVAGLALVHVLVVGALATWPAEADGATTPEPR